MGGEQPTSPAAEHSQDGASGGNGHGTRWSVNVPSPSHGDASGHVPRPRVRVSPFASCGGLGRPFRVCVRVHASPATARRQEPGAGVWYLPFGAPQSLLAAGRARGRCVRASVHHGDGRRRFARERRIAPCGRRRARTPAKTPRARTTRRRRTHRRATAARRRAAARETARPRPRQRPPSDRRQQLRSRVPGRVRLPRHQVPGPGGRALLGDGQPPLQLVVRLCPVPGRVVPALLVDVVAGIVDRRVDQHDGAHPRTVGLSQQRARHDVRRDDDSPRRPRSLSGADGPDVHRALDGARGGPLRDRPDVHGPLRARDANRRRRLHQQRDGHERKRALSTPTGAGTRSRSRCRPRCSLRARSSTSTRPSSPPWTTRRGARRSTRASPQSDAPRSPR